MARHHTSPLLHLPKEVQDMIFKEVLLLDLSSLVPLGRVNTTLRCGIQSTIKRLFPSQRTHCYPKPKFGTLLALGLKDCEIIDVLEDLDHEEGHRRYRTVLYSSWKRVAWCWELGFYDRQLNALDVSIIRGSHSLTDYFIGFYGVSERNVVTAIEADHRALAKHLEEKALQKGVNFSSWRLEFTREAAKYQKLIASVENLQNLHQPELRTSDYTRISYINPGTDRTTQLRAASTPLKVETVASFWRDTLVGLPEVTCRVVKTNSLTLDQKGCRALLMRQPMCMGRNPALWATPRK
uniref:F-box domain-containing protein n=1 Tax=Fusarium oxysporum (strain Fo5176) TaxID=660025 RepID=A0A0D2YCZ2_FUSOF